MREEEKISFNDMIWVTVNSLKIDNYERISNMSFDKERGKYSINSKR
jgi:hypothetical protein